MVARSSTGYIFKDEKGQTVMARAISCRELGRSSRQSRVSFSKNPFSIVVISQIVDPKSTYLRSPVIGEGAQDNSSVTTSSNSHDHNCQTMSPSAATPHPLPLAMLTLGVVVDPLPPASQEDDASHFIVFQLDMIIHIALLGNDPTFS
ncbi:unnamed protein product [Musa banksii]